MKKKLLIIVAALTLAASLAACGQKNDTAEDNQTTQTEQSQQNSGEDVAGNYAEGASENVDMDKVEGVSLTAEDSDGADSATLEESAVSIEEAKVVESDGRKLLIVSYKFTNKSDSDESFTSMMKSAAYQDGMELNHAVVTGDIEGYEPDSTAEKIASGKTINVQEAYVLASEEASVEVTVQEFHSESGEGVIKEFKLQ